MLPQERLDEIIKRVNNDGKVVVKELSELFNVSEDCIRKDLTQLEHQGYLKRSYGGAVRLRQSHIEKTLDNRLHQDGKQKYIIACKAYDLIEQKDTIFLDISTTNLLLARQISLGMKQLTVVTNMLDILTTLANCKNITVLCCGGLLSSDLHGFVGSSAIENINKYHFDKAFIGSVGLRLIDNTISTFDSEDGLTKKCIIDNSKENYLVMTNEKFYCEGNYRFATLNDIQAIITDDKIDDNILEQLNANGIRIY